MQSEWQASEKYPSASVRGAAPVSREEGTLNLNAVCRYSKGQVQVELAL